MLYILHSFDNLPNSLTINPDRFKENHESCTFEYNSNVYSIPWSNVKGIKV